MSLDQYIQSKIDQYLNGRMTEAERLAFEKEIAENPALQEAVDDERLVIAAMQQARALELREKMRQWEENPTDVPPARAPMASKNRKWLFWLFGGGVLLSVLLWLLLPGKPAVDMPPDQKPSSTGENNATPIVEQQELPPQHDITPHKPSKKMASALDLVHSDIGYANLVKDIRFRSVSGQVAVSGAKSAAVECINKRDYSGALQHLAPLDSADTDVRLLRAHALFESGRFDEAVPVFRSLSNNMKYGADARWNVLMCYYAQYPARKKEYELELQHIIQGNYPSLVKRAEDWQKFLAARLQ